MATVKEFRMSQERYDELKHELEYSKTTRADEIAEIGRASCRERV